MQLTTGTMVAGLLFIAPLAAHHGTGTYDSTKSVTLSGTVTEFSFSNPHAALFFDVKDASGKSVNWAIEMNSPGVLRRAGWTKATFKAGDQITITVRPAKAGTPVGLINRAHRPAKAGTPVGLINRAQPVIVNGKQVLSGDRTANAVD
jgi:hypothetical protein